MRAILINTGTELLLGDVQDAHLAFIAREILPLGLRIEERRTVPDSDVIRRTLTELFPHCEILLSPAVSVQPRTISPERWLLNR
jgi:Predicted nucleotide-utilizing enzyme related to molybdopterin-biosynthesis enzyme MoeA